MQWLIAKDKQLRVDLKNLERGKLQPLPETDLSGLEDLLQSQGAETRLRRQLMVRVQQKNAPVTYVERAGEMRLSSQVLHEWSSPAPMQNL